MYETILRGVNNTCDRVEEFVALIMLYFISSVPSAASQSFLSQFMVVSRRHPDTWTHGCELKIEILHLTFLRVFQPDKPDLSRCCRFSSKAVKYVPLCRKTRDWTLHLRTRRFHRGQVFILVKSIIFYLYLCKLLTSHRSVLCFLLCFLYKSTEMRVTEVKFSLQPKSDSFVHIWLISDVFMTVWAAWPRTSHVKSHKVTELCIWSSKNLSSPFKVAWYQVKSHIITLHQFKSSYIT